MKTLTILHLFFSKYGKDLTISVQFVIAVSTFAQYEKFDESCYKNFNYNLLYPEPSFDNCLYICNTCHLKVKCSKTPCQSVFNKLSIEPIPNELSELRRLEKVLYISKDFV